MNRTAAPRRTWTRITLVAAMALLVAIVAASAASSSVGTESDARGQGGGSASLLFVVRGTAGSFTPENGSGTLTLTGVEPHATWFTDRPDRQAGSTLVPAALGLVGFDDDPPNGVLTVSLADKEHDALAVTLREPEYDSSTDTLTFEATTLEQPGKRLRSFDRRLDEGVRDTFGEFALFIDDASVTVGPDGTPQAQPPQGPNPVEIQVIVDDYFGGVEVKPEWDGFNNCVLDNPFPTGGTATAGDPLTLRAWPNNFGTCGVESSRMHWLMEGTKVGEGYPSSSEDIQVENFAFFVTTCVDLTGRDQWNITCGKGEVHIGKR